MFGEQRTRTLLRGADPVGTNAVPPPRLSAAELIARAEASTEPRLRHRPRPTRRLVLVAGATAVVAGAAAVLHPFTTSTVDGPGVLSPPSGANVGPVLAPIAYQIDHNPPAAAAHLRALARRLADAPYENHTGQYAYHRTKQWGDPQMTSADGRYVLGYASERETWQLADHSGRQRWFQLPPEYPDQASRDYWERHPADADLDTGAREGTIPPYPEAGPLPADRAGLAELLDVRYGGSAVAKQVDTIYIRYVVPKRTRAQVLNILADMPGFKWRGQATDRAGRRGVAITYDDRGHGQQSLLIFDQRTGALLALEAVWLKPRRVSVYMVVLDTDRTAQAG
jgi:hypothetical protein